MLRLGRGVRVQFEAATKSHVLLFPEGLVDLNDSARRILYGLPNERKALHLDLCRETGLSYPLEGFDTFVDHAVRMKWVRTD